MTWADVAEKVFQKTGRIEMTSHEVAKVATQEGWRATRAKPDTDVREALQTAMFRARDRFRWDAEFIYRPRLKQAVAEAIQAWPNPKRKRAE